MLGGVAGLTAPAMTGCAGRQTASRPPDGAQPRQIPASAGLDAVIDISHNVTVTDFTLVRRRSNILGVIHKATEGGDWVDPSYSVRRHQALGAGLLWGAYHFGTRQYPGARQAAAFLAATQPGPATLMALDFEPNDSNPRNTMTLAQAEAFVQAIEQATGRLPLVYTHPSWADGVPSGRGRVRLTAPISSSSILARCDLWLADYREEPQLPSAWAGEGLAALAVCRQRDRGRCRLRQRAQGRRGRQPLRPQSVCRRYDGALPLLEGRRRNRLSRLIRKRSGLSQGLSWRLRTRSLETVDCRSGRLG